MLKSLRMLAWRGLRFHWRSHMAVLLCVAAGSAVLTGALLVGDSMRGSLRELVLDRLGRVDYALRSTRYFREVLAEELGAELPSRLAYAIGTSDSPLIVSVTPAIAQSGSVSRALSTGEETTRVGRVQVWGVHRGFWELARERPDGDAFRNWDDEGAAGDVVVLGQDLAAELDVATNDSVLVRVDVPSDVPREAVLGRKDDTVRVLRLRVADVVSPRQLGRFALEPSQRSARNAFVPLGTLQRALKMSGRVNTMLVVEPRHVVDSPQKTAVGIQAGLANRLRPADLGLRLRLDAARGYVSLESNRMILENGVADAAQQAADAMNLRAAPVLSYLANSIVRISTPDQRSSGTSSVESYSMVELPFYPIAAAGLLFRGSSDHRQSIPYSTVAGISFDVPAPLGLRAAAGLGAAAMLGEDEVLLNEWAAHELGVSAGAAVRLEYFVAEPVRPNETAHATFRVRGVIPISGVADDPGLVPEFPGITDAKRYADWDPPFPMDLKLIRPSDEEYWEKHRATAKLFFSLAAAERLWGSRFGKWTSFRIAPSDPSTDLEVVRDRFGHELRDRLDPAQFGLVFRAVKAEGLAAATGATDFAGLFIGFSFFLIVSACILVALVFRLSVERRAKDLGLLLAVGFDRGTATKLLVLEGCCVAAVGGIVGLAAGVGYAWLMMLGLRTLWLPAVGTSELRLHVTAGGLAIGAVGGMVLAVASIVLSLRGLTRLPPRALLAGSVTLSIGRQPSHSWALPISVVAGVVAAAQLVVGFAFDLSPASFFLGGAALLAACLAALAAWLAAERDEPLRGHGLAAIGRMGARNGSRHRGRSVLTAGLVAAATFVVVTVAANRQESAEELRGRDSGAGGFAFVAESDTPLLHDLGTSDGRRALGFQGDEAAALDALRVYRFRLRPGEDASCLNLYRPTRPRILGAPADMIARGGFRVARSLAETDEEKRDPWKLLDRELPGGAIPAIGDANTVQWILHIGLGDALTVRSEDGRDVPLVIVATLAHSLFQSELVVSESNFLKLFASQPGHSYFLIETHDQDGFAGDKPSAVNRQPVTSLLERRLVDFGFDVVSTSARLAEYRSVENTYLSTFQMLGGLGLALGTLGLGAVLLRNVVERRGELALLLAVGYRPGHLVAMVLAENVFLLVVGLASGTASAMAAMAPHIAARADELPLGSIGGTLAIVFAAGLASSVVAVRATTRTPLVPALRAD